MAELKLAVTRWLEWEDKQGVSEIEKEDYLLTLSYENVEKPEQPEPLTLLREMRRFGMNFWEGGYANQPSILLEEFHACIDAELENDERKLINALLKSKAPPKNELPRNP